MFKNKEITQEPLSSISLKDEMNKKKEVTLKVINVRFRHHLSCGVVCGCHPNLEYTLEIPEDMNISEGDMVDDYDIIEQYEMK